MKEAKFKVLPFNIKKNFNLSMFDTGYNLSALLYRQKAVVLILAKVILNIDVFLNKEIIHEYNRTTTFFSTSVQQIALVHDRKMQLDPWDWI